MKKLNIIFTGKFLKIWYIAFVIIVALMVWDYQKRRNVENFTVYVYSNDGDIVETKQVSKDQINLLRIQLPVTKAFIPNK